MILQFLILFIVLSNLYVSKAILLSHRIFESRNADEIQAFSLLESKTIHEIVLRMSSYQLDSFNIDFNEIKVKIIIVDELVFIDYGLDSNIYARFDYDLVFNSSMNYQIISKEDYLNLTKNEISIK